MELEELHVHDLGAGAVGEGDAVAAGHLGIGADAVELAGAAGGEHEVAAGVVGGATGACIEGADADGAVAFDEDLCSGCATCVSVCPYDAVKTEIENDKRIAKVNEILCQGCGSCSAACPSGASQQHWFMNNQLRAMVGAALGEEEK